MVFDLQFYEKVPLIYSINHNLVLDHEPFLLKTKNLLVMKVNRIFDDFQIKDKEADLQSLISVRRYTYLEWVNDVIRPCLR